jgi:hypothetical protein
MSAYCLGLPGNPFLPRLWFERYGLSCIGLGCSGIGRSFGRGGSDHWIGNRRTGREGGRFWRCQVRIHKGW